MCIFVTLLLVYTSIPTCIRSVAAAQWRSNFDVDRATLHILLRSKGVGKTMFNLMQRFLLYVGSTCLGMLLLLDSTFTGARPDLQVQGYLEIEVRSCRGSSSYYITDPILMLILTLNHFLVL